MKLISVVGARPNFVKIAPIARELKKYRSIKHILVHTGQHYDYEMSKIFFQDLAIPEPDINLGVGSGSHSEQTANIILRFEKILNKLKPDLVQVVGDVNSTLACSITAAKMRIPVAHVEAGLRSFDRSMPEEINRLVTDSVSDILFTTCKDANENLLNEGLLKSKIHFVGNVMIDSLCASIKLLEKSNVLSRLDLQPRSFCLVTIHRPNNVDDKNQLGKIMENLGALSGHIKVIFPVHPRTSVNMKKFRISTAKYPNFVLTKPFGYLDFMKLLSCAKFALTDSGGIQEETTVLKIPCLTFRDNTERPVTITMGTNKLISTNPANILTEGLKILEGKSRNGKIPPLWDGRAAERICRLLAKSASLI